MPMPVSNLFDFSQLELILELTLENWNQISSENGAGSNSFERGILKIVQFLFYHREKHIRIS